MRNQSEQQQHREVVAVSLMLLKIFRAVQVAYRPDRNSGAAFPEMLCVMSICVANARKQKPCTVNDIAKMTGLPRNSVTRHLKTLLALGMIEKTGDGGYTIRSEYLRTRRKSISFKRVIRSIKACARILERYE